MNRVYLNEKCGNELNAKVPRYGWTNDVDVERCSSQLKILSVLGL